MTQSDIGKEEEQVTAEDTLLLEWAEIGTAITLGTPVPTHEMTALVKRSLSHLAGRHPDIIEVFREPLELYCQTNLCDRPDCQACNRVRELAAAVRECNGSCTRH